MRRRKKKKIKWIRIIILMIIIILIIIGGIMFINSTPNKTKETTPKEKTKKEEVTTKTTVELEKTPKNNQEFKNLKDGEYITEKGYHLEIKDGIAYIENNIIVNKTYSIPDSFKPQNPSTEITEDKCNNCINKDAMEAFKLMQSDATSIGLNIYISSGYRSYNYQEKLYNNYISISGKEKADTYSARPGHSEHQTGTCFDLNSIDDSFANTSEGKWINQNAYLYGFIIRYPKGKETLTGYQYESWHLRYVGKELAKKLYNDSNWLTLEEYYGLTSAYE